MNIFLAYGYNDRDRWIPELVEPIIESFGAKVITGEECFEGPIPDVVQKKIGRSDALIGFTTRRGSDSGGVWGTHRWVVEELAAAKSLGKRVVEVRETGVDSQGGLVMGLQRIEYDEAARDKCLVGIVKAIGAWHRTAGVKIRLLPDELASKMLRPILRKQGLRCVYFVKEGSNQVGPIDAEITPEAGGLFVTAPEVPKGALIQIDVSYGDQQWSSDYESTDALGIHLRIG